MVPTKISASSQALLLPPTPTPYSSSECFSVAYRSPSSESLRRFVLKFTFLGPPNQLLLGPGKLHFHQTEANSCADCPLRTTALPNQISVLTLNVLCAFLMLFLALPRLPGLGHSACSLRFISYICSSGLLAPNLGSFLCAYRIPLHFLPTSALEFSYWVTVGASACLRVP